LHAFNTLEDYGPVHRWGAWKASELADLAGRAGEAATERLWVCTTLPGGGGYGRDLVDCPDLRRALVDQGLAHLYSLSAPHLETDLRGQKAAIRARQGIWAKGAPAAVLTSLHSADEKGKEQGSYNRVCDIETGLCTKVAHTDTYAACDEVCSHGSCMTFIPYERRYGPDRARCLGGPPQQGRPSE
jgi:hypothetical protein